MTVENIQAEDSNDRTHQCYAHSKEGKGIADWQPLEQHLRNVAELAADFAGPFGGEEWARLAGLWHDLGKYADEFQKKLFEQNGYECHLETKPGRVVHSEAGGHLAQQCMSGGMDRIFCWLIMGHHAGLADYPSDITGARALKPKMQNPESSNRVLEKVPIHFKNRQTPSCPAILMKKENPADFAFFIRMLFSCVVDADFLDTEAFMDEHRRGIREQRYPTLKELQPLFNQYMNAMCRKAPRSEVNRIRADVLRQCREAAISKPAVFSLTVPTGGGKTLSSLAFALNHAVHHGKRRIIYVIPYTSIIEQNAAVFREIPGFEDAVLEHHCNVLNDDEKKETVRRRLAAENWDAPIIVTTSVQFFESLFACKTGRCRKLHNIADSVVIFDEAQCLPPEYLRPCIFAVRELHQHYGVTPLLCTATQPVLTQTDRFDFRFKEGFENVVEIIEHPDALAAQLKRVRVTCLSREPVSFEKLHEAILSEGQSVLCIVNRKKDARILAGLLPDDQCIHLSTNMCAAHRLGVLQRVRERLKKDMQPLYVVSTSLVEAGVDLDFPIVYRAMAGLDSIAQAAGRCNREGNNPALGKTVVFVPDEQPGYVQSAASLAHEYLQEEKLPDVLLPETFADYFRHRFFMLGADTLDEKNILKRLPRHLDKIYFRTAAECFRLINDQWQLPLIVPFGKALERVDKLVEWDARRQFRKLQMFTISVPRKIMWHLIDEAHAKELTEFPGTYYLHNHALYTERFGFVPPDETECYEVEATIA